MRTKLLWIGPDAAVLDSSLRAALHATEIHTENSVSAACRRLAVGEYDVAVLSVAAFDSTGYQALGEILRAAPQLPVIVHRLMCTIDDVIRLTKQGAFHVLLGEIEPEQLVEAIARASRQSQRRQRVTESSRCQHSLVGKSGAILHIGEIIELVAAKRCPILISGETGTGKKAIAEAIHAASRRSSQALISVNCTALPAALIESELFGHAKGALTGAFTSRIGCFEQAHGGTLFLDEVGDLPLEVQAKILPVLQEQEFQWVGSSETVRVDVRLIAASNMDLEQAVREKRFREDLFYRLNVVPIHLPPLRERREDIPLLVRHFMDKTRAAENEQPKQISDEAMEHLQQLPWPGNVRQLEHAVQLACAVSGDRRILGPNDFQVRQAFSTERTRAPFAAMAESSLRLPEEGLNFESVVSNFELSLLNQALIASGGNKARAADLLGLKRTTLLAKMKTLATMTPG